ncbi:MAG: hypothetical protein FGM61_05650 [Sediminibacterium sp.]|nr:hypothetical protein [Sediminibacterium sp.]
MLGILLGVVSKVPVIFTIVLGTVFVAIFFVFLIVFVIRYFQKLYQLKTEREKLQAQLANEVNNARNEIQQTTLNNISQEIHDNVGQLLSLTKMQLNLIEQELGNEHQLIKEAKQNISRAMSDLRDLAKGMSSDRIRLLGLYESVVQEAVRINKIGKIAVRVHSTGVKQEPEHQKQLVIFRVIQECFQNIIKHAEATEVEVAFIFSPEQLAISISDNGVGFDVRAKTQAGEGLGLMNVYSRVQLVGGVVTIKSDLGEGTKIELRTFM